MAGSTDSMRVAITGLCLLLCMFATFYFLVIWKTGLVYTHLFYVPIVIVSAWWHRKGVIVVFSLVLFLLICNFFFAPDVWIVNNLERSAIFLFISILTSTMFEHRKRTEEELRKTKIYLKNLLNYANAPIIVWDNKKRITLFNNAFADFTGYEKESMLGTNIRVLFPPLQKEEILQTIEKATKGEMWKSVEIPILCKGKETKIALWNSANITDKEGRIIATIAQGQDITERKKMENRLNEYTERLREKVEELRRAQEQLLKSERLAAIGEAAAMVGHDLRNPLQAIENATYYLNNKLLRLPIPQKIMEMLQVIEDSVDYADRIISDLQDFSTMKKPILRKTDVKAIVKETLSQVEAPGNVELITELDHLPEIKLDKDMIKRVFLNLAINGIQAMENGGKLKVSTKKTKGFVEVSFKDTGIGMSRENMEKISAPFFTTKAKGMGMGLAICKKFVDSHGGSIDVKSEEGKGSTFTVRLPLHNREEVKTSEEE